MLNTPPRIINGAEHSIELQLLSDGRCGLAIDDRVIAVSANAMRTDQPVRVRIDGQSVGTTIMVGALQAWTGIRNGIDWSAMPNARAGVRTNVRP